MRVLFLGNSHTYFNDMPELFARMCADATGKRPEVTMLAYSGRSLEWHCTEYFSMRFALLYGKYDYCVLQQQAHPFPGKEETVLWVSRILSLCRKTGTKPILFMTWAEKEHPDHLPAMQETYRGITEESGSLLLPIGELFSLVQKEHPEISLYWKDGEHASPYGDYLIAATLTSLLCGSNSLDAVGDGGINFSVSFQDSDGLPSASEDPEQMKITLDPETARILRKAAASF